jgi:uncharacterized protein YecE (DUF72 family)
MNTANLYCGTSGIVLPVPNKLAFPETFRDGSRLTYYASLFNSLEVNSSFYKIPLQKTFARWIEEVPATFRFTVKLWRGITHVPSLAFAAADVERFMRAAAAVGSKKGCLLVQLPPGLKAAGMGQLERLLAGVIDQGWKIAVEFRDKSWYTPATDQLLERFGAVRVLQDMPASYHWEPMSFSHFIYLRYHGPAGDYKGGYAEGQLKSDAARIKTWLKEGKDVYVYFNNTIDGALPNARTLLHQLQPAPAVISSHPTTGGAR